MGKGSAQTFKVLMMSDTPRLNQEEGFFFHRNVFFCLSLGLWSDLSRIFSHIEPLNCLNGLIRRAVSLL